VRDSALGLEGKSKVDCRAKSIFYVLEEERVRLYEGQELGISGARRRGSSSREGEQGEGDTIYGGEATASRCSFDRKEEETWLSIEGVLIREVGRADEPRSVSTLFI